MNNKNYFIFAAAIALASCSVDEYVGENPEFTQTTKENIIGFGGGTGSMSRMTSNTGTTEEMLDKQFKVYGWKTVETVSDGTSTTTTQTVFDNYWVWYSATATPSNPETTASSDKSWEYVGNKDDKMPFDDPKTSTTPPTKAELEKNQYIKYWDYSATDYKFVAGSPISAFTFNSSAVGAADIVSATVTGLGGHINPNPNDKNNAIKPAPVYIADPVKITKGTGENDLYGKPVNFNFTRLQTKVRVGIYETIPGYNIKSIEFYKDALSTAGTTKNVTLFTTNSEYFFGGNNITGTVEYKWEATPSYTFTYGDGTTEGNQIKKQSNWFGGMFDKGIKATSSNPSQTSDGKTTTTDIIKEFYGEDEDMDGETGYFIVLPTPTKTTLSATTEITPSALTLKCNYTLESEDGSLETINVKGATAAIPAAYCKWEPNKMYTYIFKISQETNGTTGTPGTDDPGLFPITFDATVIEETESQQGTETIINSPSITTHQEGSVTTSGIEYITKKEIVITVADDSGNLKTDLQNSTLATQGYIAVYSVTEGTTEADLTVTAPTGTTIEVTLDKVNATDANNNKATFTPSSAGTYAIQYHNGSAYFYKVIEVTAASGN